MRQVSTVSHLEHAYSPSRVLDTLAQYLPSGPGNSVLELGCAPGRWLAWAASHLGVRSVGLELDAEGVRLARLSYPTLLLVRADAFELPFADESFDAVYSLGLIEHFADPGRIVTEVRRVLRRSGITLWLVPNLEPGSLCRWHWRTFRPRDFEAHQVYTLEGLANAVARGGFIVEHQEYSGLYIPYCQRIMGRLPFRTLLKSCESPRLASNLIVVARPIGAV
jgi:ubiquinone/menaquinone biosynthesis C-methylase UbiE